MISCRTPDRGGATPGVVDLPPIQKEGANRGRDDAIPERPPGDGEQEGAVDAAGVGHQTAAEGAETLFEAHEPRVCQHRRTSRGHHIPTSFVTIPTVPTIRQNRADPGTTSGAPVLVIDRLAAGGDGVGRIGAKVAFVARTAPGDEVEVEVREERRTWCRARVLRIVRPGPDRIAPPCPSFGACGGCDWQHLSYPAQLAAKRSIVEDALRRIGRSRSAADRADAPLAARVRLPASGATARRPAAGRGGVRFLPPRLPRRGSARGVPRAAPGSERDCSASWLQPAGCSRARSHSAARRASTPAGTARRCACCFAGAGENPWISPGRRHRPCGTPRRRAGSDFCSTTPAASRSPWARGRRRSSPRARPSPRSICGKT